MQDMSLGDWYHPFAMGNQFVQQPAPGSFEALQANNDAIAAQSRVTEREQALMDTVRELQEKSRGWRRVATEGRR